MLRFGKFCRLIRVVTLVGFLPGVVSALEIRVSNPLTGLSNPFSLNKSGSSAPSGAPAAAPVLGQKRRGGGAAANYLQAARSMEVAYAVPAASRERQAPSRTSAAPSFSDFMQRLEDEKEDPGAGEDAASAASSGRASNEGTGGAAEPPPDQADGSDPATKRGETAGDSGRVAEAGDPPASGNASLRVNGSSQRLFERRQAREDDLSEIFLFFPSKGFDADKQGDYNIVTPLDRFDFFTPPSELLPRSSSRYRSVP